jgi:hypothetical protein
MTDTTHRVCSRRLLAATQAEEAEPVPAGSGDLAGDGRQARKNLFLPAEAARDDQNLVKLALIFPDDDRADLHMLVDKALHVAQQGDELPPLAMASAV